MRSKNLHTPAARYLEIVAELRGRIERGALAPGARVPSTREIVRRSKVAMATATKVITTLRQEGLVHAVPGVGTVVADRSALRREPTRSSAVAPAVRRHRLSSESPSRARIVAAAIAIADAGGLPALSMRRVAGELDIATMSLYRHVSDKDDLLFEMTDAVCGELRLPDTAVGDWRTRIELAARMFWTSFRRHPWLATAMSVTRPQPIVNGLAFAEWVLAALAELGLREPNLLAAYLAIFNHIRGTAMNLELEAEAEADSGVTSKQWLQAHEPGLQAALGAGPFPLLAQLLGRSGELDIDALFEFGLQRLLDGIAQLGAPTELAPS